MVDHISRLPDELLLKIAFALGHKDRLNFACINRRISGPAAEALLYDSGLIPQYLIPWYISRISQSPEWAKKVRHLKIKQSRHDAVCYLSHETVKGCSQAFNYVLQQYSGSQALVQEGEDVLGLDIPQTTTRDASSWCLLLLIVLRNVERLTLMLHPDPFQHQEEPILEWGDHVQVLRHLELRSLSIFCTGQYTGLRYHDTLQLQHINPVRHLEIGTDVLAMIEPGHFPPYMDSLCIFDRKSLCDFPHAQLAKLVHRLRQIRIYFVCPEIRRVKTDIVRSSLVMIEDVMASSTAVCRIFYTLKGLEDSNQFDAAVFTKELSGRLEEKVAVLRASAEARVAEERRKCLIRHQDDLLIPADVDCSAIAEQQPDPTFADSAVANSAPDGTSSPVAPHSIHALAISATPVPSLATAVFSELGSRASLSPKSPSERPSLRKAAASISPARKIATVHLPSTDSNVAPNSRPATVAQGENKGKTNRRSHRDSTAPRGQ